MENGRKTQQNRMTVAEWHYQLMRLDGIGTGGGGGGSGDLGSHRGGAGAGISATTLFYKFRPSALQSK